MLIDVMFSVMLSVVMLRAVMLSVVMLIAVMFSVMLIVVMLRVVAPSTAASDFVPLFGQQCQCLCLLRY